MASIPKSSAPSRLPPVLTVAAAIAILYLGRDVLMPLALALLLTFLLAPLVRRLQRWWLPRVVAVGITLTIATGVVGALGWLVQAQVVEIAAKLPEYQSNIHEKILSLRSSPNSVLSRAGQAIEELDREINDPRAPISAPGGATGATGPAAPPTAAHAPGALVAHAPTTSTPTPQPMPVTVVDEPTPPLTALLSVLGTILHPLAMAAMVLVFTFFMLLDNKRLRDRLIQLVGRREMHLTTTALDDAAQRVTQYLISQSIANLSAAGAVAVGLYFIDVPNIMLWALLVFCLRFVPFLGMIIASILPIAMALASSPGWAPALLVMGLYLVVEVITGNLIEPILIGSRTGLSPLAIIVAAVFWSTLWGLGGLLLSIPLTVCLWVMGRHVPQFWFLAVILGDDEALPLQVRLYQRLLADDAEEAGKLVDKHTKDKPLAESFDSVFLPAIHLAEVDRHRGGVDDQQVAAMHESMNEMIDEVSERAATHATKTAKADAKADAKAESKAAAEGEPPPATPDAAPAPLSQVVVCIPARDNADELAARMLCMALDLEGVTCQVLSVAALTGEQIEQTAALHPSVVCISAVPPSATVHTRGLCKRLRAKLPDVRIVVGMWDARADAAALRTRLGSGALDTVVTTMAEAARQIRSLAARAEVQEAAAR